MSMENTPTTTIINKVAPIDEKSIALEIAIGRPGLTKKAETERWSRGDGNVDHKSISISKRLLRSKELNTIISIDTKMQSWLHSIAIPFPFRRGTYLVPVKLIDSISEKIDEYRKEREAAIDLFLSAYRPTDVDAPSLIKTDADRLGPEFREDDYPPSDILRESFWVSYRYLYIGLPEKLEDVNSAIFAKEKERMKKMWDATAESVKDYLRFTFQELISGISNAIKPEDGVRKRLTSSAVDNLLGFLEKFDARNITDDEDLANIVKECKALLGDKPRELLKDKDLRVTISTEMEKINGKLNEMAIKRPARKLRFDEDKEY